MLAALRTTRRIIGGALALLVLSSWLSVAVAACIEHGEKTHAEMPAMTMAMAMPDSCPHCDSVALEDSCVDAATDCELPPAVLPASPDDLKFVAVATHAADTAEPPPVPASIVPAATDPPAISGRDRHIFNCSFLE